MRVVIYRGQFQYDVVNDFGNSIGEVLTEIGHEVIYINLNSSHVVNELVDTFKRPVDFVLSFNGIGHDLKIHGESLYDYLKIPIVMWLVDHPIHLYQRIIEPINHKIVVCIDETHVDYIEQNIQEEIITSFISHAAKKESLQLDAQKRYDVVFAGHIATTDQYEETLNQVENYIPNFRDKVITKLNLQGNIDLRLLMNDFYHEQPSLKQTLNEIGVMNILDRYIRAVKRERIINDLLNQDVTIDFFGIIPENHPFLLNSNFKNHGSIPFEEMKRIFRASKMVLNILPNFPNGGHERIFTSMMQGALPLTDTNLYIKKHLKEVIGFDLVDFSGAGNVILEILGNEAELKKQIKNNHQIAYENHSWENRVVEMLYVIEIAKKYFNSKGI
ncbi:glycosyltransferase [Ureibacillus aquaedulcis]|uniref:Glycosyltransferase n=1 Tax=Ureibacillus aquaedulcis TaxID=3058421 RepID=A0ABT8GMQ8_9BACL|nr:glycosyltransferase [Ureibacillus sp. BA0131]MDN4492221.1 glycosyltransferase [Ureibacillus sp. BA0131]